MPNLGNDVWLPLPSGASGPAPSKAFLSRRGCRCPSSSRQPVRLYRITPRFCKPRRLPARFLGFSRNPLTPPKAARFMAPKILLLWDIDGTLLTAGGAGLRALASALQRVFDIDGSIDDIDFGGRTHRSIMRQIFRKFG